MEPMGAEAYWALGVFALILIYVLIAEVIKP